MTAAAEPQIYINQTGQNLIRILISSYFIGIALGLIEGTNATILAEVIMPASAAHIVSSAVVFSLAFMVMIGMWLRPAALLLSLTMFWASFITNLGSEGTTEIGQFWHDIVMIGSLMLTYLQPVPRSASRRAMLRWTPRVRRILPKPNVAPRRVTIDVPSNVMRLRAASGMESEQVGSDNIFREDFDAALVS